MARSLILLVSAHAQRLLEHCAALQEAGHWLTVPAPTLDRALALLSTVRPALVVYDAADADGLAQPLHQAIHGYFPYEKTHLLLLGNLTPDQHPGTTGDPCPHCTACPHCGQVYPATAGAELVSLLAHVLAESTDEKYPPLDDLAPGVHPATPEQRNGRDGRWAH